MKPYEIYILCSNPSGNHNSRSKSKKQQLNKSASSADHLDKTGGFEASVAPPVALGRRGFRSGAIETLF